MVKNEGRIYYDILTIINKKRFLRKRLDKREAARIAYSLRYFVFHRKPVMFLMMWGVGTKQETGCWEEYALNQLSKMFREIKKRWQAGCSLKIIYADTHARINRVKEAAIEHYYASVMRLISNWDNGIQTEMIRLSALWAEGGQGIQNVGAKRALNSILSKEQYEFIKRNAKLRYHGADYEEGARRYVRARLRDNVILKARYSDHIFLTYNNPAVMGALQPNLPLLYVWSLRRGRSSSPWFMPNEECP